MKKILFTFALMVLPLFTLKAMTQDTTYMFIDYEKMPEYPGGERQWKKDRDTYMETRLKELFPKAHPDSLATDETKRRIIVQFTIDKKGEVQIPSIFRGIHPTLDHEALRYVRQLPRFKPGAFDGKPWSVKFTVPLLVHPYYLRLLEKEDRMEKR